MNEQGSSSSYHVPDDVAFLTGGDSGKAVLYGRSKHSTGQIQEITFSKEQACCIVGIVLMVMLMIALVAAFARPTVFCGDGYGNVTENSLLKNTASSGLLETGNKDFPWQEICLPPFVKPLHYSIFIHPNLTTFWNEGTVNITLEVLQATNFVVIHKKDLNITVQDLFTFSGEQIKIVKSLENTEHEQLYLEFETVMKPLVEYVLHIQFNRPLQETLEGFYISSYIPSDGQKRYLATTQFEPTAARSAFPCFDEPDMKATFTLQIVHEQDYDVYFNSDLNISLPYENGLILSVFNPTVRMSTYLVAFLLCDFSTIQGKTKSGIDVKVIVPKSQMSQSVFAMESCVKILEYYERFFDIPYPLTKLDMAAIPDFSAGAMENWGLVTYRMNAILHDSEESSSESQEWVAIVIAHELAHQWFGNLVTMKWWNDLWLNEGFATYVEFIGADFLKPDWQVKEQFIFFVTQRALQMDSLKSSHPITSDVKDPAEISANFDAISYKKGGALIQMLESFLGINTLQEGLTLYLNKYKYRNAETRDLWDSLTKVINDGLQINISYVMDTWTIQEGFPVILVSRMENMVYVHQKRFLLTPSRSDEVSEEDISPYGYEWDIPITYITDRDTKVQRFMLNTTTGTFSVKENVKWLKLNVNQTGFFRVAYEEKEWRTFIEVLHQNHEIKEELKHVKEERFADKVLLLIIIYLSQPLCYQQFYIKLFCGDRASLLDDAFSLARNGMLNSSVPLDMTSYLQKEKSYVPWGTAFLHFNDLDFLLYETSVYSLFQSYVRKLLQPLVNYLGWKDEGTHMTKKLRSLALVEAIYFGHKKVLAEGKKLFDSWMNNGTWIPPNLRSPVYFAGITQGGTEEWQYLWKCYQKSTTPSEKELILSALGVTTKNRQLMKYLEYSLDPSKVRAQDTATIISNAAKHPAFQFLTWRFLYSNWNKIFERIGSGSFGIGKVILDVTSHLTSQFDYDQVKSFFESKDVGSGKQAVQQSQEQIQANIYWKQKIQTSVVRWLENNV